MKKFFYFVFLLIIGLSFAACPGDTGDNGENSETDGIKWDNEPGGTLDVRNNSLNDIVLFTGQLPSSSSILGGVRKSSDKTFDISVFVDDFASGGYMLVRGMTIDEYKKNKSNLASAKVEYSAFVIYGQGMRYRAEINSSSFGDYCFKVTNTSRFGIELRKDSPDGEKISYLHPMAANITVYTNSADAITVFPIYLYYNQNIHQLTTFTPTSQEDTVSVIPRNISNGNVTTYSFPVNPENLQNLIDSYIYPAALIRCTNNVPNQTGRLQLGETVCTSQDGHDTISSGETLTFELLAANEGREMNLNMSLFNRIVIVPVKQNGNNPIIKNGYAYTLTLNYTGNGSGQTDPAAYSAVINEGLKLNIFGEVND